MTRKNSTLVLLILYCLSYLMNSFFYLDVNKVFSEGTIENTNIIAIIVDQKIYNNQAIQDEIKWYTTEYLQKKIDKSKATVIAVNTDTFKARDISEMLENMYFDGEEKKTSTLLGVILLGNIPLPVVKKDNFIFPSVYPYVDFQDQKYIFDSNSKYFIDNINAAGQAEIRHSIIKYDKDTDYVNFFEKLKKYDKNPKTFVEKKIRYDDIIALKKYFAKDSLLGYINNFLFTEDLGYHRYNKLLLSMLQGAQNKQSMNMASTLATDSSTTSADDYAANSFNEDGSQSTESSNFVKNVQKILDLLKKFGFKVGGSSADGVTNPLASAGGDGSSSTAGIDKISTLVLKKSIDPFLKKYTDLMGGNYLSTMNGNVKTVARWSTGLNGHVYKVGQKDNWLLGDAEEGLMPLLIEYNGLLENALDQKIQTEGYSMSIPIPTSYVIKESDRERSKCVWGRYDYYDNFYFGTKASEITKANQLSIYRGTFKNLSGLSTGEANILPSKSLGGTYGIFNTQIEANRGYDLNKAQEDIYTFNDNKIQKQATRRLVCERRLFGIAKLGICTKKRKRKSNGECVIYPGNLNKTERQGGCENYIEFAARNFGGAFSMNLNYDTYKLSGYNYKNAILPIFDVGGSKAISTEEKEGYSYQAVSKYASLIQTKVGLYDPDPSDIKFPNQIPTAVYEGKGKKDLRKDLKKETIAWTNIAPKPYSNADFFEIFEQTNKRDNLRLYTEGGGCRGGNGNEYSYKIISSTVKNISPTSQEINGFDMDQFAEGGFFDSIYKTIKGELARTTNNIIGINDLNSQIAILNTNSITLNSQINAFKQLYLTGLTQQQISVEIDKILTATQKTVFEDILASSEGRMLDLNDTVGEGWLGGINDYFTYLDEYKNTTNEELQLSSGRYLDLNQHITSIKNLLNNELGSKFILYKQNYNALTAIQKNLLVSRLTEISDPTNAAKLSSIIRYISGDIIGKISDLKSFTQANDEDNTTQIVNLFDAIDGGLTNKYLINDINGVSSKINDKKVFTIISATTPKHIPGMNQMTIDRAIDSQRNVTFKGAGGDLVTFKYPNLYEVNVFNQKDGMLKLKTKGEIKTAIMNYLIGKATGYNEILTQQKTKAPTFYNQYKGAFDYLGGLDPTAKPKTTYNLLPVNYFVQLIGNTRINELAELLYYQNLPVQERQEQSKVIDDINNITDTFDVNNKISYVIANYLKENNYQGDFITPSYNKSGYEVAYLNTDGLDYISIKDKPSALKAFDMYSQKFQEKNQLNIQEETKTIEESNLNDECNIDPSGTVILTKRPKAFSCWLKATIKKPFELKFDFSSAQGPVMPLKGLVGELTGMIDSYSTELSAYKDQRGDTSSTSSDAPQENYSLNVTDQSIEEENNIMMAGMNDKNVLNMQEVLQYTITQISGSNNRHLDDPTQTKAISISSTKNVGDITLKISATGDNCFSLSSGATILSKNICTNKVSVTVNTFFEPKMYNLDFEKKDGTAGTTVLTFELCKGDTCVKKIQTVNIIPGNLNTDTIQIITPADQIIAGGVLPIIVEGYDDYGNKLGQQVNSYKIVATTGELSDGGLTATGITFNHFGRANFLYYAPAGAVHGDEVIIFIQDSEGNILQDVNAKRIRMVRGDIAITQDGKVYDTTTSDSISYDLPNTKSEMNYDDTKITIKFVDKDKKNIETLIGVSSKNGILTPGIVQESEGKTAFFENAAIFTKDGTADIYLNPSYKAGEEDIEISVPGLDAIHVKFKVNPGPARIINLTLDSNTTTLGKEIDGSFITTDVYGNEIQDKVTVKLSTTSSLAIGGKQTNNIIHGGKYAFKVQTKNPGGEGYIYANIVRDQFEQDVSMTEQQPTYQNIVVQRSILPLTGLNVMYLNLFGTDRGNQRGYFSDNTNVVNDIMSKSNKTLATTTQLIDPTKIKSIEFIILSGGQIKNIAQNPATLSINNGYLNIQVNKLGSVAIDRSDAFSLQTISNIDSAKELIKRANTLIFIPETSDSLTTISSTADTISINGQGIFDLTNGTITNGLKIALSKEYYTGYNIWNMTFGGKTIGKLIIADITGKISKDNFVLNKNYLTNTVFSEGSTNGAMGIGIYNNISSFSQSSKTYKSIEDSADPKLYIGFRGDFKNITYFGDGKSVGEATIPFGSEFLINFGDPLLTRIDPNDSVENSDFDFGLGENIYSDPSKTIFKTLTIDFNNDGLKDIIIVYTDGTIKLLKNYGGNNPYKNLQNLTILSDGIKEVFVGDVDANEYQDIIIRTEGDQLRAYTNNQGIFDVDGKMVCLDIAGGPDRIDKVNNLFIKDMNIDGATDIVTNDENGDIKIFYGGSGNYISTLPYTCDEGRAQRQTGNVNLIKHFGIQLVETQIKDESIVRWNGIEGQAQTGALEEENLDATITTNVLNGIKAKYSLVNLDSGSFEFTKYSGNNYYILKASIITGTDAQAVGNEVELKFNNTSTNGYNMILDTTYLQDFDIRLALPLKVVSGKTVLNFKYAGDTNIDSSDIQAMLDSATVQGLDSQTAMDTLDSVNKYISNPFARTLPAYETLASDEIQYASIAYLTGNDPVGVFKTYRNLSGGELKIGNIVETNVYIIANKDTNVTFADQILGPRKLSKTASGKIKSLTISSGTWTNDMKTHRNIGYGYQYMIDNLKLKKGDIVTITYNLTYKGAGDTINISVDNVMSTGHNDTIPDIKLTPKDSCAKWMQTFFNKNEQSKQRKTYDEVFIDIQAMMNAYYNDLSTTASNTIGDFTASLSGIDTTSMNNGGIPGLDGLFEAWANSNNILGGMAQGNGQIDLGNIKIGLPKELEDKINNKIDETMSKMCQGFKLGAKNTCQGPPVPFNQAFLAPGNYHIFGCKPSSISPALAPLDAVLKTLDRTLGKGMPTIFLPGWLQLGPYQIPSIGLPFPPFFKNIASDGFFSANPKMVTPMGSQMRIYLAPTLTMKLGVAICLGPYTLGANVPKLVRDLGGNCVVTYTDLLKCNAGGAATGNASDQELDPRRLDAAAMGQCTNPPKVGGYANKIPGQTTSSTVYSTPFQVVSRGSNSTVSTPMLPLDEYGFGLISITREPEIESSATSDMGMVELEAGAEIKNKQRGGTDRGLPKCIIQDWLDRQIKYVMNNLTQMTVGVTFPDPENLTKGFASVLDIGSEGKEQVAKNEVEKNNNLAENEKTFAQDLIKNKGFKKARVEDTITDAVNNPFDVVLASFKNVPLINLETKNVNIKVPFIYAEDINKYIGYTTGWISTNSGILKEWKDYLGGLMGICGDKEKIDKIDGLGGKFKQLMIDLKEMVIPKGVSTTATVDNLTKSLDTSREILSLLQNNATKDNTTAINARAMLSRGYLQMIATLNLLNRIPGELDTLEKEKEKAGQTDLATLKATNNAIKAKIQEIKDKKTIEGIIQQLMVKDLTVDSINEIIKNTESLLLAVSKAVNGGDKYEKCAKVFMKGDFGMKLTMFETFEKEFAKSMDSVRKNIKVLEMYKKFPAKLYDWMHVTDRYLSEVSSILSSFVGTINDRLKTNATRYSKYVDSIILMIGMIKTRQVIIDFSVNRSEKCSKCTIDTYDSYSCSLSFLCPKLPILPIPPFKIPNIWIDLSNIDLGIDILLPKFNFTTTSIPLPKIPNLPHPPESNFNFDTKINLNFNLSTNINIDIPTTIPNIPILPEPPELPEIPSFIPNVKLTLPILPPAPKIPKIIPEINLAVSLAEIFGKIYCILKGNGIPLVAEKGVKARIEQLTQRTREVPLFDSFDLDKVSKFKDPPLQGFDYEINAFVNMQYNFEPIYTFINSIAEKVNSTVTDVEQKLDTKMADLNKTLNNNVVTDIFADIEDGTIIQDLSGYIQRIKDGKEEEGPGNIEMGTNLQDILSYTQTRVSPLTRGRQENGTLSISSTRDVGGITLLISSAGKNCLEILDGSTFVNTCTTQYQKVFNPFSAPLTLTGRLQGSNFGDTTVTFRLCDGTNYCTKKTQTIKSEILGTFKNVKENESESSGWLEYSVAYKLLKEGLLFMKSKADGKSHLSAIDGILAIIGTKSTVTPEFDAINKIHDQAQKMIKESQKETRKLAEQIKNDYNGFLNTLKNKPIKLVDDKNIDISLSTNLMTLDNQAKTLIASQDNPNKDFFAANKTMAKGYLTAINTHDAQSLRMDQKTYDKTKNYLQDLNEKIDTVGGLFESKNIKSDITNNVKSTDTENTPAIAYNSQSNVQTQIAKKIIAQGSNSSQVCTDCGQGGGSSTDLSSYINGIFVKSKSGGKMLNVVQSEENISQIGDNYFSDDINKDGTDDLVMRDAKNVYVKYAKQNHDYGNRQSYKGYYAISLNSPVEGAQKSDEGYYTFGSSETIKLKLFDTNFEVKNFKMAGQDFDSISFTWTNNNYLGDAVSGYLIEMNNRIDVSHDKNQILQLLGLGFKPVNDKKFILILPQGTSLTGLEINIPGEGQEEVTKLLTGTIFAVKYFNTNSQNINTTLYELPRTWKYSRIATLQTNNENFSERELADGKSLLQEASPWSNQIVIGQQIIGDTKGPEGDTTLYRPMIKKDIGSGDTLNGFVSTTYTIKAEREDNVAVSKMWIDYKGKTIKLLTGKNLTGEITLDGLFYTGKTVEKFTFSASDFNDNISTNEVTVKIDIPDIKINEVKTLEGDPKFIQLVAEISNDIDQGFVSFSRKRNNMEKMITGYNGSDNGLGYYKLVPLQLIVTGGNYEVSDKIGLYMPNEKDEFATLSQSSGEIIVLKHKDQIKITVDFLSQTPTIKLIDTGNNNKILFKISLPSEKLIGVNSNTSQIINLDNAMYGNFQGGKYIKNTNAEIYVSPKGFIYVPSTYASSLTAEYKFLNNYVNYQIKDGEGKDIATVTVKIKTLSDN